MVRWWYSYYFHKKNSEFFSNYSDPAGIAPIPVVSYYYKLWGVGTVWLDKFFLSFPLFYPPSTKYFKVSCNECQWSHSVCKYFDCVTRTPRKGYSARRRDSKRGCVSSRLCLILKTKSYCLPEHGNLADKMNIEAEKSHPMVAIIPAMHSTHLK